MKWQMMGGELCLNWMVTVVVLAQEGAVRRLPEVVVTGMVERVAASVSTNELRSVMDSAGLLQGVPGAATVRNGPLTGMAQLRRLFGDRVKVVVDGTEPTPACPNHMDPPLHYLAPRRWRP